MDRLPPEIIDLWTSQDEGQFFERKSAYDQSRGSRRQRKAAEIALDIVETLSAMANADGGELVIGIEDHGEISGVPHPADKLALLRMAPGNPNYINPPLHTRAQEVHTPEGNLLLYFRVEWSPEVHQLADGRYLLRVNDSNQPFDPAQIVALKQTKRQGLLERSFFPSATLDDIDLAQVQALFEKNRPSIPAEKVLQSLRLVEDRNGRLVPNLAGLLLFGRRRLSTRLPTVTTASRAAGSKFGCSMIAWKSTAQASRPRQ